MTHNLNGEKHFVFKKRKTRKKAKSTGKRGNEVDVLVVFSNRYLYGINSVDVEVVKTLFLLFFRLGNVSACNRKQEIKKTQIEPNPCYFLRENFGESLMKLHLVIYEM